MEALIFIICGFAIMAVGCLAAYFYAESRSHKRFILKQEEWIGNQKSEIKDLTNKLLVKQGSTPLGHETRKKDPKPDRDVVVTPTVVTRSQMEARANKDVPSITIHADKIAYPRVPLEAIEQAKKIIEQ